MVSVTAKGAFMAEMCVLRRNRRLAIAAVGVLLAAVPDVAEAHRGDGVFTLAEGARTAYAADVAMLPDGSVVGVHPFGAWRMPPDGLRARIRGFGGSGVAATSDGGALAIQGVVIESWPGEFDERPPVVGDQVVRWAPGAGVTVVAGTGERGFGGDGGPATSALLNLFHSPRADDYVPQPDGIVARPDGGFVFTDMGNGRIRAVDAAGIIRTIAGGAVGTLRDPVHLAATPDGGYLVVEADWLRGEDYYLEAPMREHKAAATTAGVLIHHRDGGRCPQQGRQRSRA
jgi:hypothetical protein